MSEDGRTENTSKNMQVAALDFIKTQLPYFLKGMYDMKGMLEGINVLDLTQNLVGPFCTMNLADMGAKVIKVENPPYGDNARIVLPFIKGESAYFMSINRGKKGITLNLKSKEGKKILLKMIRQSDVLVQNFRPGVMERLGLGYDDVRELNPKLIYAAISGFGQDGSHRDKRAYDMVVQGYGGVMSITGTPGGEPVRVGYSIGDLSAGLYATISILGAIIARNSMGEGQYLDISMFDCQIALMENAIVRYSVTGEIPTPKGNRHPSIAPFQAFKAADGYFTIAVANEKQFNILCDILNIEDIACDDRFRTNSERVKNVDALQDILTGIFENKSKEEWIKILEDAGIPCGPVNDVRDVFDYPVTRERNMIIEFDHPVAGKIKISGSPIKASLSRTLSDVPPPTLGQHNEEILQELGLKSEELISLKRKGVI